MLQLLSIGLESWTVARGAYSFLWEVGIKANMLGRDIEKALEEHAL